jgi:hypothetical protein
MGSIFMKDDNYKTWLKDHQYRIPKHSLYIASRYGDKLTYNQITELYVLAVREVLITHNISLIDELPWGTGFGLAEDKWVKMMEEALKAQKSLEGENENV